MLKGLRPNRFPQLSTYSYVANHIKYVKYKNVPFRISMFHTSALKSQNVLLCTDSARSNPYVSFSELMAIRRSEASRSIIVQIHSPQSCTELHSYCSGYGNVKSMNHYTTGAETMHLVIMEFDSERAVQQILSSGSHVRSGDELLVPVLSPFLWFRASGKEIKRRKQVGRDSVIPQLNSQHSTTVIGKDELDNLLAKAKNISEQMVILQEKTMLSDTGVRLRFLASQQIQLALSGMFPFSKALPFGSSVNSFGKEGCDLDIVVALDPREKADDNGRLAFHSKAAMCNERSQTQRHMECIADILQLFLPGCVHVRRILQARVPIIKYNQEHTGLECDLSMTNMTGVYMSDLLYTLSCIDQRVRPLVFTIRRWAYSAGLTASNPGRWITNFSLTLLVLSFLQRVNILPTIDILMKLAESSDKIVTEDGVNCTFLHDLTKLPLSPNRNTDSLESLLLQFFEHYASFDFSSRAISLNGGKDVNKPEHSALYIVNPLERHYNVSKNVSIEELDRFRVELRNAAWSLESQETSTKSAAWGLLALFQPNLHNKKRLYAAPVQNRLVEVTKLFENELVRSKTHSKLDDTILETINKSESDNIKYKNLPIEKEVQKVKQETAANIKKLLNGTVNSTTSKTKSKSRSRRR